MSCPHCLHGRAIAVPDSGSYYFRAPRDEEEARFSEPCPECCAVCFGCQELREVAAAIDGDEFCAGCAVALCVFATEAA